MKAVERQVHCIRIEALTSCGAHGLYDRSRAQSPRIALEGFEHRIAHAAALSRPHLRR